MAGPPLQPNCGKAGVVAAPMVFKAEIPAVTVGQASLPATFESCGDACATGLAISH
jgi:hypothetical protein